MVSNSECRLIKRSGLFDSVYYLHRSRDLEGNVLDLFGHYLDQTPSLSLVTNDYWEHYKKYEVTDPLWDARTIYYP